MQETKLRFLRFERDRLPELFQGLVRGEITSSASDFLRTDWDGNLVAIWNDSDHRINPLPNMIVGSSQKLADLCAWAKAYMGDVGPISGLLRLVTPRELMAALEKEHHVGEPDLLDVSVQIAVILAEVAARAPQVALERISLKACQSTLSYAIFRAFYQGLMIDSQVLADRWTFVRRSSNRNHQDRISEAVLDACRMAWPSSEKLRSFGDLGRNAKQKKRKGYLPFPSEELSVLERLLNDPNLLRKPKEELVVIYDRLIGRLDRTHSESDEFHRLLAELISKTTVGLANQLALAGPASSSAPEAVIWLGILQRGTPPAEVLSAFNGIGWKLLSRLTDRIDISKRPDCDVSFDEASLFDLSRPSTIWDIARGGRIRVELAWGISTEISPEESDARNADVQLEAVRSQEKLKQIELDRIEYKILEALEMLRRLREPNTRRRK